MSTRQDFLDERRAICRDRFDTLHAGVYDERWGSYVNPTHQRCVEQLLARLPTGARVLDAACGTGKYWPLLVTAGVEVVGADQSVAMLRVAAAKHPEVELVAVPLQELAGLRDLTGAFDAVLCIDALENVGPEDWPGVVDGLRGALRSGGTAYVTVELPDDDELATSSSDDRLVAGEVLVDDAYHYYPSRDAAVDHLGRGGFEVVDELVGDGYLHLLLATGQPTSTSSSRSESD